MICSNYDIHIINIHIYVYNYHRKIITECSSLLFLLQVENPPDPPDNYNGRDSPYDNVPTTRRLSPRKRPSTLPLFISQHTNIDDMLGTATLCHSPVLSRVRKQERVEEGENEFSVT